jgi:hypothetical protein
LSIICPEGISLLEAPGIIDKKGIFHFPSSQSLILRFAEKKQMIKTDFLLDIDIYSQIHFQEKLTVLTTYFIPARPISGPFTLNFPKGAKYISSSLKGSWIKKESDSSFRINLPSETVRIFSFQFAIKETKKEDSITLTLPTIANNNGKQGNFTIAEPDDAKISITSQVPISNIPISKVSSFLRKGMFKEQSYMKIPSHESLNLTISRFIVVKKPEIVLDSIYFFSSFEENGDNLSVLKMSIPPEGGKRLILTSIPQAEIWSLKVNKKTRKVFSEGKGNWIIPLVPGETSNVELAFLKKGEKLGLHGKLEGLLPAIGLSARNIYVGIALPERVQLVTLEGPISPCGGESWNKPKEFIGTPHYFSKSFYKGKDMKFSLYYKEPIKNI